MHDEDYKAVVKQTIQSLPEDIRAKLNNMQIIIEERPPIRMAIQGQISRTPQPIRFSLFEFPDKITIYKKPLLRISSTLEEARGHIKDAVIKEISTYFGISEFELRRVKP